MVWHPSSRWWCVLALRLLLSQKHRKIPFSLRAKKKPAQTRQPNRFPSSSLRKRLIDLSYTFLPSRNLTVPSMIELMSTILSSVGWLAGELIRFKRKQKTKNKSGRRKLRRQLLNPSLVFFFMFSVGLWWRSWNVKSTLISKIKVRSLQLFFPLNHSSNTYTKFGEYIYSGVHDDNEASEKVATFGTTCVMGICFPHVVCLDGFDKNREESTLTLAHPLLWRACAEAKQW